MSTIGNLTPNDIGKTRISVEWKGDTISGVLRDIKTDTWRAGTAFLRGTQEVKRGTLVTDVKITFNNFNIGPLPTDHPCEVIA